MGYYLDCFVWADGKFPENSYGGLSLLKALTDAKFVLTNSKSGIKKTVIYNGDNPKEMYSFFDDKESLDTLSLYLTFS